jgi:VWFA-related protein
MVTLRVALAAMLLVSSLASAAQTQPEAASGVSAPQHSKKDSGQEAPATTLRLEVRRVPIDVVVTDKEGNPVRSLSKDDFAVKEDKKTQKILSFDYVDGSVTSYVPAKLPPLPTNTFVNEPTEPERGPLYVLYYDMVNTPMGDQMTAHKQLLDFVDHAQPGSRFALFVNAAGLHMIQGFTSDHALLHAAILSKGPGPHVPDVFMYGSNYGSQDAGAALQCLKFIADYLGGIPGRKNLIWLASVFPVPVGPTMTGHNSNTAVGGGFSSSTPQLNDLTYLLSETIKQTYSAMMRSQVALYPVDLEGQNPQNDPGDQVDKGRYEDAIAGATGGHAYYGGNRLQVLMDKAVENGESYYTLSYDPANTKFDGSEREVEVTLTNAKKGEYSLSYRTLYYAVTDDDVQTMNKKDVLQSRFLAAKTADTLYANIEHGAPIIHDLLFSTHLATEGKPAMATAEQMAELQDSPAYFRTRQKNHELKPLAPVLLQKYRIGYGIVDAQLKLLATRKGIPAQLEFAAAAYDADGRLLNSMLNEGQASPGTIGKAEGLFHAEQELEVPPGAAWIRLAVRDRLSNRMGTMEVQLPLKPQTLTAMTSRTN